MRMASRTVRFQISSLDSLGIEGVDRIVSSEVGRDALLGGSSSELFESSAATPAMVPTPAAKRAKAETKAATVRNLLRSMVFITPLTSIQTDAETSPGVVRSRRI